MRKTLSTLGLVVALLLMAALPAMAAPNNANNADDLVPLDCEAPVGDAITVRPVPGEGKSGWNVDTGKHYVAKQFSFRDEVTVEITDGAEASATFEFVDDSGAKAPANGRKELVECTDIFEFVDGPFPLDAEFAAILNAEFETDIFAEGQEVTISSISTFTVLLLVPGA
jgi:hypothetical protein